MEKLGGYLFVPSWKIPNCLMSHCIIWSLWPHALCQLTEFWHIDRDLTFHASIYLCMVLTHTNNSYYSLLIQYTFQELFESLCWQGYQFHVSFASFALDCCRFHMAFHSMVDICLLTHRLSKMAGSLWFTVGTSWIRLIWLLLVTLNSLWSTLEDYLLTKDHTSWTCRSRS